MKGEQPEMRQRTAEEIFEWARQRYEPLNSHADDALTNLFNSGQEMVLRDLGRYLEGDDQWWETDHDPFARVEPGGARHA
jgi:hypothetical protein